jgi:sortase A
MKQKHKLVMMIVIGWLFFGMIAKIKADEILCKISSVVYVPNHLTISSIGLASDIVPVGFTNFEMDGQTYGQWNVDDNLIGWHNLSATLGQSNNIVLNGHSDIYGMVFRNLQFVQIGDVIIVYSNAKTHHYIVTQKIIVQETDVSIEQRTENARLIAPTYDERLTIVTCWGDYAKYRLIVIAHPLVTNILEVTPVVQIDPIW